MAVLSWFIYFGVIVNNKIPDITYLYARTKRMFFG